VNANGNGDESKPSYAMSVDTIVSAIAGISTEIYQDGEVVRLEVTIDELREVIKPLANRLVKAQGLIDYMCEDINKALGLPRQSPADTVGSVRSLMAYVEAMKRQLSEYESRIKDE
jgi:hypothetical protein